MFFDVATLADGNAYKLIASIVVPRPIAWVTSVNGTGVVNAAPYSFFNAMAGDPPVVAIGISRRPDGGLKDSGRNIVEAREWVVNLVPDTLAEAMNATAAEFPPEIGELEQTGLGTLPSRLVRPPRIAGSPAAMECRLLQVVPTGGQTDIALGRVVAFHIADEAVIDPARCHIDTPALRLVGRMHGGGWYARTDSLFEMKRPPSTHAPSPPHPGA